MPPALFEPLKEALIKEAGKKGLDFGPVRAVDLAKLTGDLQQFMEVREGGREGGRERGRAGKGRWNESVEAITHQPSLPPSLPPPLGRVWCYGQTARKGVVDDTHPCQAFSGLFPEGAFVHGREGGREAEGILWRAPLTYSPSLPPSLPPFRFCSLPTLTKPSSNGAPSTSKPKEEVNGKKTLPSSSPSRGRCRRPGGREGGREGGFVQWWLLMSRSPRRRGRD